MLGFDKIQHNEGTQQYLAISSQTSSSSLSTIFARAALLAQFIDGSPITSLTAWSEQATF